MKPYRSQTYFRGVLLTFFLALVVGGLLALLWAPLGLVGFFVTAIVVAAKLDRAGYPR